MEHDFDRIIDRRRGMSEKWRAYAEDVLPMWVADSDFSAPEPLIHDLESFVRQGVFGYTWSGGSILEDAVIHWMSTRFGWQVAPAWVTYSLGVVTALDAAVRAFTEPGQAVVILTPSYPPFFSVAKGGGRELLCSPLRLREGVYAVDFADLEEKLARPATKLFMLCSPHNPTGRCFTRAELLRMGELCERHGVVIFSDEIHCDYVSPEKRHIPFASLSPSLAARSLVAVNPSKTFNIADLHAGAVICSDKELLARFKQAVGLYAVGRSSMALIAIHSAYTKCAYYADQVNAYIRKNMEYAVEYIADRIPGISAYVPEATYLLWLDCRDLAVRLSAEPGREQEALEAFFLEKAKVALNSGAGYGAEGLGFMRLNLACPMATVKEGLRRIEQAVAAL